jgi:hypothetical protein
LYQTSTFFLIKKSVLEVCKWDETKLVYADREGQIPEDVQFSFDLIKNNFELKFCEEAVVWHSDNSYTEFNHGNNSQTLKKDFLKEKFKFEFFLPDEEIYINLLKGLKYE